MANHPNRSKRRRSMLWGERRYAASPPKEAIIEARKNAGLTQEDAAALINRPNKYWWSAEKGMTPVDPALWELFLMRTNQHPKWHLLTREVAARLTKKFVYVTEEPDKLCEECRPNIRRATVIFVA